MVCHRRRRARVSIVRELCVTTEPRIVFHAVRVGIGHHQSTVALARSETEAHELAEWLRGEIRSAE